MLQNQTGNKPPQVFRQKIWVGNKGILIIEILVVVAILGVALTSLLGLISFSLGASSLAKQTIQADMMAQEAMEAMRSIRDNDWAKLANGNYGLTNTGGYWDIEGTENVINGFARTILIEGVQRDDNDDIIESGGINDPNTKKVTATVSWEERGRTHQVEIITYLTDWK